MRISDWSSDVCSSDLVALFSRVAQGLRERRIAFLFIREADNDRTRTALMKQKFGGPVIANGGYDLASAARALEQGPCDVVAFGQAFIANPDLVARLFSRLGRGAGWERVVK